MGIMTCRCHDEVWSMRKIVNTLRDDGWEIYRIKDNVYDGGFMRTSGLSHNGFALYVCNILWLYHGESNNVNLKVHFSLWLELIGIILTIVGQINFFVKSFC